MRFPIYFLPPPRNSSGLLSADEEMQNTVCIEQKAIVARARPKFCWIILFVHGKMRVLFVAMTIAVVINLIRGQYPIKTYLLALCLSVVGIGPAFQMFSGLFAPSVSFFFCFNPSNQCVFRFNSFFHFCTCKTLKLHKQCNFQVI